MIDVGPFDLVAESLAGEAVFLQLANPAANRLEGLPHRGCVRAAHRELERKQRFVGDACAEDIAALPDAHHLVAQIAGRGPGHVRAVAIGSNQLPPSYPSPHLTADYREHPRLPPTACRQSDRVGPVPLLPLPLTGRGSR